MYYEQSSIRISEPDFSIRITEQALSIRITEQAFSIRITEQALSIRITEQACSFWITEHSRSDRGSITRGWKEEESCTSELFCVLGRGLPSPKTQNHSRVQDSSSFHPRVIEPVSPTIKRRNLHVLP